MLKVICSLNKKDVSALNRYRSRTMDLAVWILSAVFIIMGILFIVKNRSVAQGITIAALGVFFPVFQYLMSFISYRNSLKNSPFICDEMRQTFSFNDGKVEVEQLSPALNTRKSYAYDDIFKAAETRGYFYLYLDKTQVIVIGKNGEFVDGDTAQLRTFLKEKLKEKFKAGRD